MTDDKTLAWIARQDQIDAMHRDYQAGKPVELNPEDIEQFRVDTDFSPEAFVSDPVEWAVINYGPFTDVELRQVKMAMARFKVCANQPHSWCDYPESYQGDHTNPLVLENGKVIDLHY